MAATFAQVKFINHLKAQIINAGQPNPIEGIDLGAVTVRAASGIIENLKALAQRPAPSDVAEGYYRIGDDVAEVRISREGRPYGLLLDEETGRFDFTRGLIFRIASQGVKLTLDYAEEFGRRTHRCAICGRTLTVKESIERGIGPRCAARLGA